jgi:hypothetical protein
MAKSKVIDLFGDSDKVEDLSEKPYTDAPQAFYETIPLMIEDFNRFFIQVLIGSQPSVIWEHDNDYTIFSYEQYNKQFSYVRIASSGDNKSKATKIWLDSYNKRTCPGIKFWPSTTAVDPNDPENKLFNTWRGWATKPVENKALWKIIFKHIYEVTCNRNITKANHYLNFFSHLLQRPEQKPSFGLATRRDEARPHNALTAFHSTFTS